MRAIKHFCSLYAGSQQKSIFMKKCESCRAALQKLAVLLRTFKKSKLKLIQKLESQETELNSNKN